MVTKKNSDVIVLGSGHLATRLLRILKERGYLTNHIPLEKLSIAHAHEEGFSMIENLKALLKDSLTPQASALFIVSDDDRRNIEFVLAIASLKEDLPIFVTLFNDALATHLRGIHKNLHVCSPARVSASSFARVLEDSINTKNETADVSTNLAETRGQHGTIDALIALCIIGFLVLWIGGSIFFRWSEGLSWIDALYFTATTMTTVGYGDFSLRHASTLAKSFGIALMFLSAVTLWTTFSLVIDRILKQRSLIALGKKRYGIKDHVIVCGLGRVGYGVVEELVRRKKKVLIIELDHENRFSDILRSQGVPVFIGDATLPKNLLDVGVRRAAGVISLINDDLKNLEVGLNARTLRANVPLVLRIFDGEFASEVTNQLNVDAALSTSTITAIHLADLLEKQ